MSKEPENFTFIDNETCIMREQGYDCRPLGENAYRVSMAIPFDFNKLKDTKDLNQEWLQKIIADTPVRADPNENFRNYARRNFYTPLEKTPRLLRMGGQVDFSTPAPQYVDCKIGIPDAYLVKHATIQQLELYYELLPPHQRGLAESFFAYASYSDQYHADSAIERTQKPSRADKSKKPELVNQYMIAVTKVTQHMALQSMMEKKEPLAFLSRDRGSNIVRVRDTATDKKGISVSKPYSHLTDFVNFRQLLAVKSQLPYAPSTAAALQAFADQLNEKFARPEKEKEPEPLWLTDFGAQLYEALNLSHMINAYNFKPV